MMPEQILGYEYYLRTVVRVIRCDGLFFPIVSSKHAAVKCIGWIKEKLPIGAVILTEEPKNMGVSIVSGASLAGSLEEGTLIPTAARPLSGSFPHQIGLRELKRSGAQIKDYRG